MGGDRGKRDTIPSGGGWMVRWVGLDLHHIGTGGFSRPWGHKDTPLNSEALRSSASAFPWAFRVPYGVPVPKLYQKWQD